MNDQIRSRIKLAIRNAHTPWEAHKEGLIPSLGTPEDCAQAQRDLILSAVLEALEEEYEYDWQREDTKEIKAQTSEEITTPQAMIAAWDDMALNRSQGSL